MQLQDPHRNQPLLAAGTPLEKASAAVILLHGRGAGAADILGLAGAIGVPGITFLAPQASQSSWYPQRFLAPLAANQPWLDSALATVERAIETARKAGLTDDGIAVGGFSQGACLALEYAARNARRFGAVIAFSGGLIGPEIEAGRYRGDLAGTPVFLGCSDVDAHIPVERVHASAAVMRALGGTVETKIYPGMGHLVNQDEVDRVAAILATLAGAGTDVAAEPG